MKHIKYLSIVASGIVLATSCTDTFNETFYDNLEKPNSIAELEYLNAYPTLKEALKSNQKNNINPNFLLGCGVTASEYNQRGGVYALTNTNFQQITAGNAMKYASIVGDKGEMNFSTVKEFVAVAEGAGMQVYGHTLCWHEQQNTKWLNSLIADKELEVDPNAKNIVVDKKQTFEGMDKFPYYVMGYEPAIVNGILTVPEYPGDWYQFFVVDGLALTPGREYTVTAKIKGEKDGRLNVQIGNWGALKEAGLDFTSEWSECSVNMPAVESESGFVVFQPGTYDGKLEIEWVQVSHGEAPAVEIPVSLMAGGDAEEGQSDNLIAREKGNEDIPARIVDDPAGTGKVYECNYNSNPTDPWDSQFFITSNEPLEAGTKIHVKFRYRATDARNIETQAHGKPGSYHHWSFIGTLNATTEWKEHEYTGTISGEQAGDEGCSSIAFNLCSAADAGTFYIDDVVFEKLIKGNTIPLTPEEKKDVLIAEMERWVSGMMNATEGKVKAWDVVNEAISGGPWGQRYDLQHSTGDATKFYWQDYLGDDFVRVPVKFARQYFAENGGNPEELKLFINDYNLESDWDDNQKLKSLISWIEQWESDGETKIDGIGSQMHINYYLDDNTQKSKEDHIVKMFELMAKSGKLCRITELDMGLVDADGNPIKTADVTLEQQKLMADHYAWVIQKYFEIIPAEQQYGICQWAQTDSPEGSGWRAGEPIGLWTLDYQRKPTYGGFADGLQGK